LIFILIFFIISLHLKCFYLIVCIICWLDHYYFVYDIMLNHRCEVSDCLFLLVFKLC
jgi:hypothetical protein